LGCVRPKVARFGRISAKISAKSRAGQTGVMFFEHRLSFAL
jgi:hypothetical protein